MPNHPGGEKRESRNHPGLRKKTRFAAKNGLSPSFTAEIVIVSVGCAMLSWCQAGPLSPCHVHAFRTSGESGHREYTRVIFNSMASSSEQGLFSLVTQFATCLEENWVRVTISIFFFGPEENATTVGRRRKEGGTI